jgi:predicted DNA-binding transcriptional regulator AlpA
LNRRNQLQDGSIMNNTPQSLPVVWASDSQLAAIYSVSRATIWRWAAAGRLPKPTKLSPGATRWKVAEVAAILENQSA